MKVIPYTIALLITIVPFSSLCADQEFYRTFLSVAANTNAQTTIGARAPQLVDTNNTALKVTNAVLSLRAALSNGELARIRLGMTMEEVVAAWGKPAFIYRFCMTGPRFNYKGVQVYFEAGSNAVERISLSTDHLPSLQFDEGLSPASSRAEWVRVFGNQVLGTRTVLPALRSATAQVEFLSTDDTLTHIWLKRLNDRKAAAR